MENTSNHKWTSVSEAWLQKFAQEAENLHRKECTGNYTKCKQNWIWTSEELQYLKVQDCELLSGCQRQSTRTRSPCDTIQHFQMFIWKNSEQYFPSFIIRVCRTKKSKLYSIHFYGPCQQTCIIHSPDNSTTSFLSDAQ